MHCNLFSWPDESGRQINLQAKYINQINIQGFTLYQFSFFLLKVLVQTCFIIQKEITCKTNLVYRYTSKNINLIKIVMMFYLHVFARDAHMLP